MQAINLSLLEKNDLKQIEKIGVALSSPIRVNILNQIDENEKTVTELVKLNNVSFSSIMFHLKLLTEAGLVRIIEIDTPRGKTKSVNKGFLSLKIDYTNGSADVNNFKLNTYTSSLPVGCYVNAEFGDNNGFVLKDKTVHFYKNSPFLDDRYKAGIVFTNRGFVEYYFDNTLFENKEIVQAQFSFEICSETSFFNNNYESKFLFFINDIEVCDFITPGDLGGRRGFNNPATLSNNATQFGQLKTITISQNGVAIDGVIVNNQINIDDLKINKSQGVKMKIKNIPIKNQYGGFNLFGKEFGDFPQDIDMKIIYI